MVSNVEIKRRKYVNKGICITCNIYVANPNSVIFSSKGTTIYELRNTLFLLLVKFFGKRELSFNILGVSNPDTDARILAYFIREQLEKRISHKRVMQSAILKAKKSGVKGVKVQISGRLNGAEIARTEWEREGQVPLQTLRANIDYCSMTARVTLFCSFFIINSNFFCFLFLKVFNFIKQYLVF
jgi:small subunit ribosomal protein S3